MKIYFVYNTHSGSAVPLKDLKEKCLAAHLKVDEFIKVSQSYGAILKQQVKKDDMVIIYGGDGTISSVITILADTDCVFAPVAGGTMNHFTKDLGISQEIDEAIARLTQPKPRRIDVADVNGKLFVNNSSIGFYPLSLRTRERLTPRIGKWPAAVFGVIGALVRYRTYDIAIGKRHLRTPFIFIGNNDYRLETAGISGNRTRLDKGELSIYTIDASDIARLVALVGRLLFTRVSKLPGVHVWKGEQVTITSRHEKAISISRDGEVSKVSLPIVYKILPKKIRII